MKNHIFDTIDELVLKISNGEIKGFKSKEHIRDELPLDSLDRLTFLLEIGEKFGIEINVEEAVEKELRYINNLVGYLESKTKAA